MKSKKNVDELICSLVYKESLLNACEESMNTQVSVSLPFYAFEKEIWMWRSSKMFHISTSINVLTVDFHKSYCQWRIQRGWVGSEVGTLHFDDQCIGKATCGWTPPFIQGWELPFDNGWIHLSVCIVKYIPSWSASVSSLWTYLLD